MEFAEDALKIRKDPIALNALVVTATRSNNVRAKQAVRAMTAPRDASLLTIDIFIAQEKYDDALEKLSKSETSGGSDTALRRRVENTTRYLVIAMRQKDEPAFQDRLAADWPLWFVSDDDFNAFGAPLDRGCFSGGLRGGKKWLFVRLARRETAGVFTSIGLSERFVGRFFPFLGILPSHRARQA